MLKVSHSLPQRAKDYKMKRKWLSQDSKIYVVERSLSETTETTELYLRYNIATDQLFTCEK